jgi:hypothetical protein
LEFLIDRQIGQITTVSEIGYRPGDANQLRAMPCGDEQVGVCDHVPDAFNIVHGSSFGKPGTLENVDVLARRDRFDG